MTADELELLIRKTFREELDRAGLRLDAPEHQDAAREDFRFIRRMRLAFDGAASKIGYAILTAFVGGFIWLIVQGANLWKGS